MAKKNRKNKKPMKDPAVSQSPIGQTNQDGEQPEQLQQKGQEPEQQQTEKEPKQGSSHEEQPKEEKGQPEVLKATKQPPLQKWTTSLDSVGNTKRTEFNIPREANVLERKKKVGKEGRKIVINANHFEMGIQLESVVKYSVDITLPWNRVPKKSDEPTLMRAFEEMKKKNRKQFPQPYGVVFDGRGDAFSTRELDFPGGIFEATVQVMGEEKSDIELKIKMKRIGVIEINKRVEKFCREGNTLSRSEEVTECCKVINTVFSHIYKLESKRVVLDRCAFSPPKGHVAELSAGKAMWFGVFSSFRPAWKPFLNVDMANKPGYLQDSVMNFFCKVLSDRRTSQPRRNLLNLNQWELNELTKAIRGLKIRFNQPNGGKRDYRANGMGKLTSDPQAVSIKDEKESKSMSVEEYFKRTYKVELKHKGLPTLHVGVPSRNILLPMEFCEIKQQACPSSKKLNEFEAAKMIRETAIKPDKRQERILDELKSLDLNRNPFSKEFGLTVADHFTRVDARVLTAPSIMYHSDKNPKEKVEVINGRWKMENRVQLQFLQGKSLKFWGVLDLARLNPQKRAEFVDALYDEGLKRGLDIDYPFYEECDESNAEMTFNKLLETVQNKTGQKAQLIMVFSPKKSTTYGLLKHLGDVVHAIPTQFVMQKNVLGKQGRVDMTTVHNICLKLNSKLGGVNQALHDTSKPDVLKRPVMFLGADVTHPSPDQIGEKPSIAAIVGSVDPKATIYYSEVRTQYGKKNEKALEVIMETENMVENLLMKFYKYYNGRYKPEKIFYYRDGISEGQFFEVLQKELSAIRRACEKLEKDYKPGITVFVAQKRHKTRIFPQNPKDGTGKAGNVPPGTVVDTVITNPTEESFFLASHEGLQGTTKPTGYHVLWDDNNLSPDDKQKLTYFLCHLYTRCERSVSYPTPTYYAHLAAFRAREHHSALISKGLDKNEEELKKLQSISMQDYFV